MYVGFGMCVLTRENDSCHKPHSDYSWNKVLLMKLWIWAQTVCWWLERRFYPFIQLRKGKDIDVWQLRRIPVEFNFQFTYSHPVKIIHSHTSIILHAPHWQTGKTPREEWRGNKWSNDVKLGKVGDCLKALKQDLKRSRKISTAPSLSGCQISPPIEGLTASVCLSCQIKEVIPL